MLPESRGSKLFTGFPTAFWRSRTDGLSLKGGAMYTPWFGGSSAERKDISPGFQRTATTSRPAMIISTKVEIVKIENLIATMFDVPWTMVWMTLSAT